MSVGRYTFGKRINRGQGFANPRTSSKIFRACEAGVIPFSTIALRGGQRLDVLAHETYGDASFWWVIAAASGIGYAMQASHGSIIRIPNNLSDVIRLVS